MSRAASRRRSRACKCHGPAFTPGFAHQVTPPAQPASDVWPDQPEPIQFCATELIEALTEIRNRRDQEVAQDHELAWEHGTLPSALIA